MIIMSATTTVKTNGNMRVEQKVKKHDWGTVVAGIVLALFGLLVAFWPGLTLLTLASVAGIAFGVVGIIEIIGYFIYRNSANVTAWQLVGGFLNIILAVVFLANPFVTAISLPWLVGIVAIVYGIFAIAGGIDLKKILPSAWGWFVANGIVAIICGVLFIMMPESFVFFLAVFLVFRGITMAIYGAMTPSVETTIEYSDDDEA